MTMRVQLHIDAVGREFFYFVGSEQLQSSRGKQRVVVNIKFSRERREQFVFRFSREFSFTSET